LRSWGSAESSEAATLEARNQASRFRKVNYLKFPP